ncbi:uncharacterized protein TRIADDRAFT_54154 [Trichoplax adhaerens]|uniref:Uncharacterized protein n=1 Tax=Trichoplax adhaerens TaxID=10228 RepID=B3RR94_TRIAD|nr:predicted protein [Trichoplax adhaerens]EDV26304.1 predicted protein [Trichoplax adhaerens]|eukprot:XP_002110300.1 predicted protein [Trichoplax adhaerens]
MEDHAQPLDVEPLWYIWKKLEDATSQSLIRQHIHSLREIIMQMTFHVEWKLKDCQQGLVSHHIIKNRAIFNCNQTISPVSDSSKKNLQVKPYCDCSYDLQFESMDIIVILLNYDLTINCHYAAITPETFTVSKRQFIQELVKVVNAERSIMQIIAILIQSDSVKILEEIIDILRLILRLSHSIGGEGKTVFYSIIGRILEIMSSQSKSLQEATLRLTEDLIRKNDFVGVSKLWIGDQVISHLKVILQNHQDYGIYQITIVLETIERMMDNHRPIIQVQSLMKHYNLTYLLCNKLQTENDCKSLKNVLKTMLSFTEILKGMPDLTSKMKIDEIATDLSPMIPVKKSFRSNKCRDVYYEVLIILFNIICDQILIITNNNVSYQFSTVYISRDFYMVLV